jgi:hypothetical protein
MGFDRRYVRRAGAAAAAAVLAVTLVACGSDEPESASSPGSDVSATPTPETPTPSGMTGQWTADPGQADRVQQTLTTAGFECTKSSEPSADLRVCSKGRKQGENRVAQANLRFLSDSQGTVVLAALETSGSTEDLEKKMSEAVLPAADAAVLLAGGKNLTWGSVDENKILTVKGWTEDQSFVPTFKPLATTKEKALPPLQAAKLKCRFAEADEWGNKRSSLTCTDPSFKVKDEDGSIAGATAELVLVDNGEGIESIQLDGSHSRTPAENARGVRLLVPKALSMDTDQDLQDAGAWVLKHLDNLPHSGYVGRWRVDIVVVPDGGIAGWPYVRAYVTKDKANLGKKTSETPGWSPSTESESPDMTETPTS